MKFIRTYEFSLSNVKMYDNQFSFLPWPGGIVCCEIIRYVRPEGRLLVKLGVRRDIKRAAGEFFNSLPPLSYSVVSWGYNGLQKARRRLCCTRSKYCHCDCTLLFSSNSGLLSAYIYPFFWKIGIRSEKSSAFTPLL